MLAANILNIGADLGAMAATVELLAPGIPFLILLIALSLGILALEVFIPYRSYAVVLKVLALSLFAYVATGLIGGPAGEHLGDAECQTSTSHQRSWRCVVGCWEKDVSLSSGRPTRKWAMTCVPREATARMGWPQRQALLARILRSLRLDTVLGMLSSEVATWFIIFTTGSVLHNHGITNITTADQAAAALAPLVHTFPHSGVLAKVIFAVGILGVGLLGIPVLAGSAAYAVAEAFHWKEGLAKTFLQAPGFYIVIGTATLVGMLLNLLGINPISALVYSAVINGIVAVPLLVLILLMANNRTIMQTHVNGRLANGLGILTTLAMAAAVVALVVSFFWR